MYLEFFSKVGRTSKHISVVATLSEPVAEGDLYCKMRAKVIRFMPVTDAFPVQHSRLHRTYNAIGNFTMGNK